MNSATNPRKFAEKIAKLHQKEQEQTQAFEQIMAEVIVATRQEGPKVGALTKHHLHINQAVSGSRAESLPNVNHVSRSGQNSIDLQSALSNLEEIKQGKNPGRERRHSPGGLLAPHVRGHSPRTAGHPEHRRPSPASPYSTPYLSPPDTWRRTNSDSALHQSSVLADRQNGTAGYSGLQHSNRRSPITGQMGSSSLTNISNTADSGAQSTSESWDDRNRHLHYQVQITGHPDMSNDSGLRPKSCDVPGITIFPSQEDGSNAGSGQAHMPLSANTGSLPDLSSFHFPAPLSTPIDSEELAAAAAQSCSTPASTSHSSSLQYPNPGSPYGTTRQQPASPYSVNSNPNSPFSPQSPLSALGYSPPGDGQLTFDNVCHMKESSGQQQSVCYTSSFRNTAAPTITVEGLALDTSALSLDANHHYQTVRDCGASNGACATHQHPNLTYASNSQVHSGICQDRNGPPSEHSNSAPSSPLAPQHHPASPAGHEIRPADSDSFNTGFQTNVLQHQFEQFTVLNNFGDPDNMPMLQGSAGHSSSSSASSSTGGLYMGSVHAHSHNRPDNVMMGQGFVDSGNGLPFGRVSEAGGQFTSRNLPLSASCLMSSSSVPTLYSKSVISCAPSHYNIQLPQRHTIHSPQASDSIPEIVLTEPVSYADGLLRHDFSKELGSAMGSFDASDLFSSDSFKSELPMDPIDFDGLQILTEMTESEERMEQRQ